MYAQLHIPISVQNANNTVKFSCINQTNKPVSICFKLNRAEAVARTASTYSPSVECFYLTNQHMTYSLLGGLASSWTEEHYSAATSSWWAVIRFSDIRDTQLCTSSTTSVHVRSLLLGTSLEILIYIITVSSVSIKLIKIKICHYNCVLCLATIEETMEHLFLQCPFAQQCWDILNLQIANPQDPISTPESFKIQLNLPFFMDIVIIMCWCIWMARNDLIFRGIQPSVPHCKDLLRKEFALVKLRAKKNRPDQMSSWIETIL